MKGVRSVRDYGFIFLKGLAMGAADAVPGVSGGTIALIAGIYEELIASIRSVSPRLLVTLGKEGFAKAWSQLNGNFLVALGGGIAVALISLAHIVSYLLEHHSELLFAFFFGLIIASIGKVAQTIERWNPRYLGAAAVGAGVAATICLSSPATGSQELWFVFVSGLIAICAMILPGISGSFILLLLGMYHYVINALKTFDLVVIVCFASGCGIGIISFSHVLGWLLKSYREHTIAVLTGFMAGSLIKVWPWKVTVQEALDHHGRMVPIVQESVLPTSYEAMTGLTANLTASLGLMVAGAVLVVGIEKFGSALAMRRTR